jgi:hypothetical protein
MTQRDKSYLVFVLEQIIPAPPGWQAVYFVDGAHVCVEVPLFALVERRIYRAGRECPEDYAAEELREVVGMVYAYADTSGFYVAEELAHNYYGEDGTPQRYCGLLPASSGLTALRCRHP